MTDRTEAAARAIEIATAWWEKPVGGATAVVLATSALAAADAAPSEAAVEALARELADITDADIDSEYTMLGVQRCQDAAALLRSLAAREAVLREEVAEQKRLIAAAGPAIGQAMDAARAEGVAQGMEEALKVPSVWSDEERDGMSKAFSRAASKHGHYESLFAVAAWLLRSRLAKVQTP